MLALEIPRLTWLYMHGTPCSYARVVHEPKNKVDHAARQVQRE